MISEDPRAGCRLTAPNHRGAEIRLREIRSHEGSQARAWEELTYQLRPPAGVHHVETRKTRAPDAGVEWYEVYDDGPGEGFQAKFHATLEDALGGMRESVKAVCTKRPKLTKLTFVLPYDFTDSGTANNKTGQDRWDDAVARWRTDFPAASQIEFKTIRAGDITARLTMKEHAGRREYWFGGVDITDGWLRQRFVESAKVVGQRYTPEADSPSSINATIDAVSCGPTFLTELQSLITRATTACRQDSGIRGAGQASATPLIDTLDEICARWFGATEDGQEVLAQKSPDVDALAAIAKSLLELAYVVGNNLRDHERRNLDAAIYALEALHTLSSGRSSAVLTSREFALIGPAGQGKTHALMRAVEGCLDRGVPALAILGQRLSGRTWWPAVAETLGGISVDSDLFLQALDSMAESCGCRALVAIDAINESQSPKRWRDELPALLAQFQQYPHLALIVPIGRTIVM